MPTMPVQESQPENRHAFLNRRARPRVPRCIDRICTAHAAPAGSEAGPVTFSKDVAPIVFENCLACHRPGEVAPMSLSTFQEARPWAKSIKDKVVAREMPPWFADPEYGTFHNDARLSQEEIDTIAAWVDQGAKQGNPDDMPPLPEFADGWQLGEPDFIVDLPRSGDPGHGQRLLPRSRTDAGHPRETLGARRRSAPKQP
jgi:hypothetical protein